MQCRRHSGTPANAKIIYGLLFRLVTGSSDKFVERNYDSVVLEMTGLRCFVNIHTQIILIIRNMKVEKFGFK